jgi:hypothetical protein
MKRTTLVALASLIIATSSHAENNESKPASPAVEKAFFTVVRLGRTIDQCQADYHKFAVRVDVMWHSGAPKDQKIEEYRLITYPQRRIYVHYWVASKKIVSVGYMKVGANETFSQEEMQFLTSLNQGHGALKTDLQYGMFSVTPAQQNCTK